MRESLRTAFVPCLPARAATDSAEKLPHNLARRGDDRRRDVRRIEQQRETDVIDLPQMREYFIPDFSDWKNHDAFESAFARLLQDLRADERTR